MQPLTAFAVDFIGAGLTQVGWALHKHSHRLREKNAGGKNYMCSPVWLLGSIAVLAGSIVHVLVLPYADLTLLSTVRVLAIL